jgi:hypothetical protein
LKIFVTISFILLHLFTTTAAGELLKLPLLVHHYFEHDEKDDHESIIHFLLEHYAELHAAISQHHVNDHRHLPFKTTEKEYFSTAISLVPNTFENSEPLVFNLMFVSSTAKETSAYSHFLADIWQPPRL